MSTIFDSNRFWIILLLLIVVISAATAFFISQSPNAIARIYTDGELKMEINLSEVTVTQSITIYTDEGYNVITIESGQIRVSKADCPDGSCVNQGWLGDGIVPIVCLPHRLIIRLAGAYSPDSGSLDAVAG